MRATRLVARTDRRDADPVDRRRYARAAWQTCCEPVLPAFQSRVAGRQVVGRCQGAGRRPHDRHGRSPCAELQREACSRAVYCRRSTSNASSDLTGGDIFHGALTLDHCSRRAPVLGHAALPRSVEGPVHVRRRDAPGRRSDRHPRPQRGARDSARCAAQGVTLRARLNSRLQHLRICRSEFDSDRGRPLTASARTR